MKKEKYNIRTDLASESLKLNKIESKSEIYNRDKIGIIKTIVDEKMSSKIGKTEGLYFELDIRDCDILDSDDIKSIENILAEVIQEVISYEMIDINKSKCLIVGLGNSNVTPDALGPMVVDNVIVTRHMFMIEPNGVSEGINNVCALSPGVMGTTGIETLDIIEGVLKKIDIDYLIVIDALASSSVERVNKCIQVSNTGIHPGSGVGNRRKELSKESLKIPVIAIGVPTVVDAVTISLNTIDNIINYLIKKSEISDKETNVYKKEYFGKFALLKKHEKEALVYEVLKEEGVNMFVTPKEVDIDLKNLSEIVSSAIDKAIHPIISEGE